MDLQKAKTAAVRKATRKLLEKYKDEFETMVNESMEESGYKATAVTKVVWEKVDE